MSSRNLLHTLLLVAIVLPVWSVPARGQDRTDPMRFIVWVAQDLRAAPVALVRTSPIRVGAAAAVITTTSLWDAELSEDAMRLRGSETLRVFEEFGDADAMRPLALLVFAGTLFQGSTRAQDAAFTSLESLALANVVTNLLKLSFGRARPWQNEGASTFEPFSGRTSFPSGHATTVFAGITPWLFYYPRAASWVLVGLGASTAFSRVALSYHWPSDVLGGAFVGTSVSWWLYRQHSGDQASRIRPIVGPGTLGMQVTF